MPPSTHITVSVHSHTQTSQTTHHTSSPQCLKYASFMHGLTPGWALFLPLLFALLSVLFTNATRWTTPGVCDGPKSKPAADGTTQDSETTPGTCSIGIQSTSGDVEAEGEGERESDAPPPYQPPVSTSTSTSTSTPEPAPQSQTESETQTHTWMNPKKPPIKSTSAHRFVTGTFFLLLTLTSLVLAGLSIQAATLCHPDGEFGTGTKIFFWTLYTLPLTWSTTGASSFLILLRNLWGPKMAQRFPLDQSSVAMAILIVVMFPFVFVGYVLGGPAVLLVQLCQGVCCGVRGEEGDGVELEDGRTAEVGILARERESEEEGEEGEERVALIGGGKSDI